MIRSFGIVGGFTLAVAAVLGLSIAMAPAQADPGTAEVGKPAPSFEKLPGVDDQSHSMADFKDAKVVVVCFTCNSCPVAVAYEDRFVDFTNDYKDKGVRFVAINVNKNDANRLPAMKERAEQQGFNFPYLFDESQKSARSYGAKVTPEIFVLDQNRNVAYHGAFDDNMDASKASENYVAKAVDALLAGQEVPTATTRARGCGIRYEN